jgi:hypothetical protein
MFRYLFIVLAATLAATTVWGASLVNINATQNGVNFYDWQSNTAGSAVNPVQLFLNAGTYDLTFVEAPDLGAEYVAWSRCCGEGYGSYSYIVYDDLDINTPILYGGEYFGASTFKDTFDQVVANGKNVSQLTLLQATTLDFVVPDVDLSDNLGGVSLRIELAGTTSAAPEPGTFAFAGLAMIAAATLGHRRRR